MPSDKLMYILGGVLYFAGYTVDFEDNGDQPPLNIESGPNDTYVAKFRSLKKESFIRRFITIIYQLFISSIILWTVGYGLYMAIRDKDVNEFGRTWFQVLIVVQYYYAISYFKCNHFYENILCNRILKDAILIAIPIAAMLCLSLAGMNVVLLTQEFNFNAYNEVYNISNTTGRVFIGGLLFFDSLYSYLMFLINACVFAINMWYHRNVVIDYSNNIDNYIRQGLNTLRKLTVVATEYSQMKSNFDKTVKLLSPFFSVLNFMGFTTIYFYLKIISTRSMSVTEYINLGLFLATEAVYLIAIQAVNNNIDIISDSLNSNGLISTFFSSKNFNYTMPIPPVDHTQGYAVMMPQTSRSYHGTGVSGINVNDDLNTNGDITIEITPQTPKRTHHQPPRRTMTHPPLTPNSQSLSPLLNQKLNQSVGQDSGLDQGGDTDWIFRANTDTQYENIVDGPDTITYEMLRNTMITCSSMQHMMDWTSLKHITSERWSTFKVFGVEYTDTLLIAKLYGVFVTVFMATQLGSYLSWWNLN